MTSVVSGRSETLVDQTLGTPELASREALLAIVRTIGSGDVQANHLTVVSEVFANALIHGKVRRLRVTARARGALLLLVFDHSPPLSEEGSCALARVLQGWLPDKTLLVGGGLGLPLLHRLSRRITLSPDRARLRVWLTQGTVSCS